MIEKEKTFKYFIENGNFKKCRDFFVEEERKNIYNIVSYDIAKVAIYSMRYYLHKKYYKNQNVFSNKNFNKIFEYMIKKEWLINIFSQNLIDKTMDIVVENFKNISLNEENFKKFVKKCYDDNKIERDIVKAITCIYHYLYTENDIEKRSIDSKQIIIVKNEQKNTLSEVLYLATELYQKDIIEYVTDREKLSQDIIDEMVIINQIEEYDENGFKFNFSFNNNNNVFIESFLEQKGIDKENVLRKSIERKSFLIFKKFIEVKSAQFNKMINSVDEKIKKEISKNIAEWLEEYKNNKENIKFLLETTDKIKDQILKESIILENFYPVKFLIGFGADVNYTIKNSAYKEKFFNLLVNNINTKENSKFIIDELKKLTDIKCNNKDILTILIDFIYKTNDAYTQTLINILFTSTKFEIETRETIVDIIKEVKGTKIASVIKRKLKI